MSSDLYSTSQPSKAVEAQKLLAACKWSVRQLTASEGTKKVYEVYDQNEVLLRVFIPVSRLLDYARGVFDAQDFTND